jgi:hypothetical protein
MGGWRAVAGEEEGQMRRFVPLVLAASFVVLAISPASAAPPTVTETVREKGVTESFSEDDPCLGPITVTLTYNAVFHITEFVSGPNEGNVHVTFTQAGKFTLTPDDPTLPVYRGSFAIWGGFNGNRQSASGTFTFNAVGKGTDGSRIAFHAVEHFNVTPAGIEKEFLVERFDCPV